MTAFPIRAALGLALLAACTPVPPPLGGWATLPSDAVQGAGDPTRAAILNAASVFGTPSSVAGNPAEAARAVANFEFLAVEIPNGPRWRGFNPAVSTELAQARPAVRAAIGIAPDAPNQAVIDALYSAARALRAGNQEAAERLLSPPNFPNGGAATLARLAALPLIPRANAAASLAASELNRQDSEGSNRRGGGNSGRL